MSTTRQPARYGVKYRGATADARMSQWGISQMHGNHEVYAAVVAKRPDAVRVSCTYCRKVVKPTNTGALPDHRNSGIPCKAAF
jgi:hypothetical protein